MKPSFALFTACFLIAACANPQGVGFSNYEVPAKTGQNGQPVSLAWDAMPPIPRVQLTSVGTPEAAASVAGTGVQAATAPGATLLIVEDSTYRWAVARAAKTPSMAIKSEAQQRSGCLVSGVTPVGNALVFALNCR